MAMKAAGLFIPKKDRWIWLVWMGFFSVTGQIPAADTSNPGGAETTDTLALESIVQETVRNNPELRFYEAEIGAARAAGKTAVQWDNPELTVELGQKRVWERGGLGLGDGPAWSVSVAQTFEFPGRIALRKAIANRQVELARLGLDHFRTALAHRARALGYAVFVAQEKAEAAREVARRLEALLEVQVQRDPAGVTPLLDLRILEANTVILNHRGSQAASAQQSALLELNRLRDVPPGRPLKLARVTVAFTNLPPLQELLDIARTNNLELRMRQTELAQQGFQVRLRKNERWPQVTLAPFYAAEEANDEQRIVGASLSVPLPLWNRNTGNIETAQARLQQAETSLQLASRQIELQVTDHVLAYQVALEEMSRWRADAQAQFREAATLADRHYRLGAVPVTTYVEMQLRYLEALDTLLETRREALEHRQQLELLVGQPLASRPQP